MYTYKLNTLQETAFNLIKEGKSICLTGSAGSGKSFLINYVLQELGERRIAVTAMTGIASTHINGMTLHSWAGIPVKQMGKEQLLNSILSNKIKDNKSRTKGDKDEIELEDLEIDNDIVKRWKETDLLIIDEVSMMSAEVFNKMDYLGRAIRKIDKPLGNLQLLLSGDFCQLAPIGVNERYCFESQIWNQTIEKTFILKQIVRQSDPALQIVLNEVREGVVSAKGKELLNSRLISRLTPDNETIYKNINPTIIYPHREKVNTINQEKFMELTKEEDVNVYEYTYSDTIIPKNTYNNKKITNNNHKELELFLDQHCNAEKSLKLCIGCQVMLTVNLSLEDKLVNGLTGIITDFDKDDGLPILSIFNSERKIKIRKWTWSLDHPRYILKRTQIPLILAWAITVHRSQGITLEYAKADLREAFGPGMAYVILSRIKSLSGLFLEGINYSKIKCDSRVTAFYKANG